MTEELSVEQKLLIETQIGNNKKSIGVAYLLWFFVGSLGAHNFYLGRKGIAITQLVLFVLGLLTSIIYVGVALLMVLWVWVLVDAFMIPGIIRKDMDQQREEAMKAI